jgi:hypothetical protein
MEEKEPPKKSSIWTQAHVSVKSKLLKPNPSTLYTPKADETEIPQLYIKSKCFLFIGDEDCTHRH